MLQPALNQVKLSRLAPVVQFPYSASLQRLITFTGLCFRTKVQNMLYMFYFSGIITHFLWQRSFFQICENMEAWSIWQLIYSDTVTTTTSLLNHCYTIITLLHHPPLHHHHYYITATSLLYTSSLLHHCSSLLHRCYINTTSLLPLEPPQEPITHNPQPRTHNPQPNLQPLPPPQRNRC